MSFPGLEVLVRGALPAQRGAVTAVQLSGIKVGMEVYTFNGQRLGRVGAVTAPSLVVRRQWRSDVHIPLSRVLLVTNDHVRLTSAPTPEGPTL